MGIRDGTQGTGIAATSLGAYSNPGSQVGTQNKDLGAVWQTDLTSFVSGAGYVVTDGIIVTPDGSSHYEEKVTVRSDSGWPICKRCRVYWAQKKI